MFKVLLVDDEKFIRKGLQRLINWEQHKFTLIGEAKNGGEALELINRLQPDLVITDIMMPVLDGLGLIQKVKEAARSDPEYIIISGYNDFKYAQQAIRYGVQDFILKPIDVKEMEAILHKLAVTLSKKRLMALAEGKFGNGSVLEAWLQETTQADEALHCAEALGMERASGFRFAWAEIQNSAQELPRIPLKAFQEMLTACAGDHPGSIAALEQRPGLFGILMSADLLKSWNRDVSMALDRLRTELAARLDQDVILYAGMHADCLTRVRQSYLEASESIKHKYAEDGKKVILYEDIYDLPLKNIDTDPSLYDRLLLDLEENKNEVFEELIQAIFEKFKQERFTPQAVFNSLSHFSTRIIGIVKQMQGDEERCERIFHALESDYSMCGLQRLKEYFTRMVSDIAEYLAELRKEHWKGDIEKIKKYIDSHFSDAINLKSIAAQFYMNSVYLGQLFRKTYGAYFNEYLLELRVDEAKKLLRQTDLRMYEIANRVGIPNANYFASQFEKLENISPLEYRSKLAEKE